MKKNAAGGGSIRQRKDGRWEARFSVGTHVGTGKQIQRSVYGKTQAECRKKLTSAVAAVDDGTYKEPEKITVGEWLTTWLETYTTAVKPLTLRVYRININTHIKPALGSIPLQKLLPPAIQSFYNSLDLSPKTVRNIHGILHKALETAQRIGYIQSNPAALCALPRVEKHEMSTFNDDEAAAFMQAIQGHKHERLFLFALFSGARFGEVLGLSWSNVDFESGTVRLELQMQRIGGEYKRVPLKNDKPRTLTLAPAIMDLPKQQKKQQAEWRRAAGGSYENVFDLVFTNESGGLLYQQTVRQSFKRIVTTLGKPEMCFHDLRHTFATLSLLAGNDIKTVQTTLGHYSAAFTLDTYTHATERANKESAARLQDVFDSLKS